MAPLYRLKNLMFAYCQHPVIEIDNLDIEFGSVSALIGPNGSGKSTLLSLLAFLLMPDNGRIEFMGENAANHRSLDLRRRIGMVSQNPYLLNGSVSQNVELGLKLHDVRAKQRKELSVAALKRVGLKDYQDLNVRELSGGEAQKVALARTLALDPEVLLFDEPFSYLDQSSVAMVERLISDFRADPEKSVVFTTHDTLQGFAVADREISLVGGKLGSIPSINVFNGHIANGRFLTGKIAILLPGNVSRGSHIAVDPSEIVLSLKPMETSIRNVFKGRVVAIIEDQGRVKMTVEAGETFHVLITRESLEKMAITFGQAVWLGFKSTVVKVF